jgi:uncharacterized RDD family membrane protein YckC
MLRSKEAHRKEFRHMQMQTQTAVVGEGAGFIERLIAYIIDGLILIIPSIILYLLLPPIIDNIASVVVGAAYAVYFWTAQGQTPGKMVMGLRVVSSQTGELVDVGTGILRYVGYFVSSIAFGLGFLWIIWDDKKEGWHDKIAKTRVIKVTR